MKFKEIKPTVSRRDFIKRSIIAGISALFSGGLFYFLHDPKGPKTSQKEKPSFSFPSFAKKKEPGKSMSIVEGRDRKKMVRKSIELLGGIERFVKAGENVMLKPNVAFASSPALSATTHPDIISEMTKLCYEAKAKQVYVMDNPINDPASCFLLSGIQEACEDAGGKIIYPQKNLMRPVSVKDGQLIRNWPVLYEPMAKIDTLIGLAPLKDHHRSGASMTMKNWYGFLGGRRNIFHQQIHTIIAELAAMVEPSLVILDAVDIMTSNGPTGGSLEDLKPGNTLIASTDQVAADTYGCKLLGKKTTELPFLALAEKKGAGTMDYKSLEPLYSKES